MNHQVHLGNCHQDLLTHLRLLKKDKHVWVSLFFFLNAILVIFNVKELSQQQEFLKPHYHLVVTPVHLGVGKPV